MNKLPRLQSLLNTLIDPSLRTKKENDRIRVKRILKENEKRLKQLQAKFFKCDWKYKNIN
tara:strand:- start:247 stop:426 length:180 start_codon:yes stop_codon:yes gene_type:complete